MSRDGTGDAWKHRQSKRKGGFTGIPREFTERKLKVEPQFTFKELFIMPFTQKRRYSEEGVVSYVPIERNLTPTGIHIFDAYLQYLADGGSDLQAFIDRYGMRRNDIDSLVFVLTGMKGVDFRLQYQRWTAWYLLLYTDMTIADVAKRSGIGSANNLYLTFKRDYNLAPGYYRNQHRKNGDVGRYKL